VDTTGLRVHERCCRREVLLGVGRGIVLENSVGCVEVFVFGLGIDHLSREHDAAIGRLEDGLMTRRMHRIPSYATGDKPADFVRRMKF
jgi:hypothetical protein